MTYLDWLKGDRKLFTRRQFEALEKDFLSNNPWIAQNFDFTKFKNKKVLET